MDLHPDFRDLLAELVREEVDAHHGEGRSRVPGARARSRRYLAHCVDTDAVIARASTTRVGDIDVPVMALDDLITNERASGRPQDLADVALLERVARASH